MCTRLILHRTRIEALRFGEQAVKRMAPRLSSKRVFSDRPLSEYTFSDLYTIPYQYTFPDLHIPRPVLVKLTSKMPNVQWIKITSNDIIAGNAR